MTRPITLVSLQWSDLPLDELARKASEWGYDGLELACLGDHFEVDKVLEDDAYIRNKKDLLAKYGLKCFAINSYFVGHSVCDYPIDSRHKGMLPDRVWGDGKTEGVRRRASEEMKNTARAAHRLGVGNVNGFTGSSVWTNLYWFPPVNQEYIDEGYRDFSTRWLPILDVFEEVGVKFGLEPHPTQIAYDTVTAQRALDAVDHHPQFGFNFDPSHLVLQMLNPVFFLEQFPERIFHVHIKDTRVQISGYGSILGSHLSYGDLRRDWDYVSPGRGDVNWDQIIRYLNQIGYRGPLSSEWEDSGMEREWGAAEALKLIRKHDFGSSDTAFDAAFTA